MKWNDWTEALKCRNIIPYEDGDTPAPLSKDFPIIKHEFTPEEIERLIEEYENEELKTLNLTDKEYNEIKFLVDVVITSPEWKSGGKFISEGQIWIRPEEMDVLYSLAKKLFDKEKLNYIQDEMIDEVKDYLGIK